MEVEKMEHERLIVDNPFEALRRVPDLDLLTNSIFKRVAALNTTKHASPSSVTKAKISLFVRLYDNKIREITRIYPKVKSAHEFHVFLCDAIYEGGFNQLVRDLERILGSRQLLKRIGHLYLRKAYLDPQQAIFVRREFFGRAGSILKSLRPTFHRIIVHSKSLSDLPSLDLAKFKVVVAGAPHVGKSSLVSNLTARKIKIGTYPFTTKEIYAGEIVEDHHSIIIYDTPGLLNRPFAERNNVELRAIAALKYLADLVVYLVDPTEKAGYSLEYQEGILSSLSEFLRDVDFIKVYTHADKLSTMPKDSICISNVTLQGLDKLKYEILNRALDWYSSRFQ